MAEKYTTGILGAGGPLFGSAAGNMGSLAYTPVTPSTTVRRAGFDVPLEMAMHEGSNKYENYVRAYPDLLSHYIDNISEDDRSMAEWGKHHWDTHGGDGSSRIGPEAFKASRYLPAMAGDYDPRVGVTETTYSAGIPMPDVEGYKYAYRPYEWSDASHAYEELAYDEFDIDKYPYYPYLPTGGRAGDADRILAGVRLVPDSS